MDSELEDIDQERLDIAVFLAFLFFFINSSPPLTFKVTIDKQSPHAKLLCLNISNEVEISSFYSWQKM